MSNEPKTTEQDPAARGVNEWLNRDIARRAADAWLGTENHHDSDLNAMRAALPPLVLASEVDTLRARVAELERERDAWQADAQRYAQNSAHWREKFDAAQRPQPSAPNAGEALTDEECVAVAQAMYGHVAVPMSASGKAKIHRAFAKIRELRPAPAPVAAEGERHRIQSIDGQTVPFTVDVLRREVEENPEPKPLRLSVADQASLLADIDARAPVAADAELTEDEVAELWRDVAYDWPADRPVLFSRREATRRLLAKYLELRPQPARLRMPTEEDAERLGCAHDELVAFLRTLGAEIVEGGARVETFGLAESVVCGAPFDPKRPDTWTAAQVAAFNDFDRRAAPAPAREPEPDYWTRLAHQYALTEAAVKDTPYGPALMNGAGFAAFARRRVKGEEARRG